MTQRLVRQGEGQLESAARFRREDNERERHLAQITLAADSHAPTHACAPRSAAGDEQRLRGIPCISRGVSGAVPGTVPGSRLWE